ncbi:hypothetical protein GCM10008174_35720 [Methylopila turkensis]|uniref:Uncharacterized protein n=2 Tax=Methylopila turkensis TaxID=1437816 RepID=A0A9W6JSK1_9HYPH|nr:hypothetical protein GCM10008174_35720 [Methylopila turkensis]
MVMKQPAMPKVVPDSELKAQLDRFVRENGGVSRASRLLDIGKSTLQRAFTSGLVTGETAARIREAMATHGSEKSSKKERVGEITERDLVSFEKVLHALIATASTLRGGRLVEPQADKRDRA